jgi:hypothetical protein
MDMAVSVAGVGLALQGATGAVKGFFEAMQDPDASAFEKIAAAIAVVTAAEAAWNAVKGAGAQITKFANGVIKQSIVLKNKEASDTAIAAAQELFWKNAKEKGVIASTIYIAKLALETAAKWLSATATAVLNALTGNYGALIMAAAAAAAIAAIAIGAQAAAQQKANEAAGAAKEHQNAMKNAMEETTAASNKLKSDLQSLASVMHSTSLSYDEQLAKINEITNAYGIQATALDVLSGNYGRLETQMRAAAIGENLAITEDITNNLTKA